MFQAMTAGNGGRCLLTASGLTRSTGTSSFLFQFANEHLEFRLPEITSVADIFGIKLNIPRDYDEKCPYLVVELEGEDEARRIMSRAVTIKSVCELWSSGVTYEELFKSLRTLSPQFIKRYSDAERSYRVQVSCFNRQLSQKEKIERIEALLDVLRVAGRLHLGDTCDDTYRLMEHYEPHGSHAQPSHIYFGRWICNGKREGLGKFRLDKRCFISNTSMDPTLAMIMANMAKVDCGSLVWDPFVGSGSLLVSASHFGAHVMGSDIDYNLLMGVGKSSRAGQKWRCKEETVKNNLKQYNSESMYVDVVVADTSRLTLLQRSRQCLDAIITDPPYGIREPTMKLGCKTKDNGSVSQCGRSEDDELVTCPVLTSSTTSYHMSDILHDLLHFASISLVLGGRLVFWIPVVRDDYRESQLPSHPCLRLISNSEQVLNQKVSRRLITLQKYRHLEDGEMNRGELRSADDHYAESSFRERYFRPGTKATKRQQQHTHDLQ